MALTQSLMTSKKQELRYLNEKNLIYRRFRPETVCVYYVLQGGSPKI